MGSFPPKALTLQVLMVLDLLMVVLAVAGHLTIVLYFYNRAYAHIVAHWVAWPTRLTFLTLAWGPPAVFAWLFVVDGEGLVFGPMTWSELPGALVAYLAGCWAATVTLTVLTLRRNLRPTPAAQIGASARVVDVAARLGVAPVGASQLSWLARLPRNEVWRVSIEEKHLVMPRLPKAWDGLVIVHTSDLHIGHYVAPEFFHESIRIMAELEPDLLVLTGDVADRLQWLPKSLGPLADLEPRYGKLAITGNHDFWCGQREVRAALGRLGFTVLDNAWQTIDVGGEPLLAVGIASPWCEPELALAPGDLPPAPFCLCLTHTPDNVGYAARFPIDLMLCGHNHGGQVRLPPIGSLYCPSKFGRRYDCGLFDLGDTLLYVNRGLSGNVPLRYFCPPEITRLVLHPRGVTLERSLADPSAGQRVA